MKGDPGKEEIDRRVNAAEHRGLSKETHRDGGAGDDVVDEIKELEIGKGEGDESEEGFHEPAAAVILQPVFARPSPGGGQ